MEILLQVPNVPAYIDDILITGKSLAYTGGSAVPLGKGRDTLEEKQVCLHARIDRVPG